MEVAVRVTSQFRLFYIPHVVGGYGCIYTSRNHVLIDVISSGAQNILISQIARTLNEISLVYHFEFFFPKSPFPDESFETPEFPDRNEATLDRRVTVRDAFVADRFDPDPSATFIEAFFRSLFPAGLEGPAAGGAVSS
jgi:hypothetical protein